MEGKAIGTAFLRAELLPEPQRGETRNLLREYVDVRLAGVQPGKIEQVLRRSEELHGRLWKQAVTVGEKNPGSIVVGLYIQSLNDVIDLHSKRVLVGLRSRIPSTIWGALYFVAVLAMAEMGYHAGLSGTSRSPATLGLVLTFAAILCLIADLDRPHEGFLRVSQQPLIDLRSTMGEPRP